MLCQHFFYTSHSVVFSCDPADSMALHALQLVISSRVCGSVMQVPYSICDRTALALEEDIVAILLMKLRVQLAFAAIISSCLFQMRLDDISTPR